MVSQRTAWIPPQGKASDSQVRTAVTVPAMRKVSGHHAASATATTKPEMPAVRPSVSSPLPPMPVQGREPFVSLTEYDDDDEVTSVGRVTELGEPPPTPLIRDRALLIRMDGAHAGAVFRVSPEGFRIGRSRDTDFRIDDDGISRSHARIFQEGGEYFVEDLGSSNGTFVQGVRASVQPLEDGDVVHIGPRVCLRFALADENQEKLLRQLYRSSVHDSLTNAYNRQHFDERLQTELAYANRHRTAVSLVLFDIDHFKQVNDTYGHQAGDAVLCHLAGTVAPRLRTEDVFARYGGEEFAVILRGIDLPGAHRVGERLRTAVSASPPVFEGSLIPITISVGAASLMCTEDRNAAGLVAAADRRLYLAKNGGRNRVVAAG